MFENRVFHKEKKEGKEQQKEASTNRAAGSLRSAGYLPLFIQSALFPTNTVATVSKVAEALKSKGLCF